MILPALVTAAADRTLKGAPIGVYLWLVCHRLDFESYQSLKLDGLALTLKIKRDTAARSLRLLVEGGYIERKYVAREGFGYRLRMRVAA